MPVELETLKQKIWGNLRGKINPRTKKRYTESEAFAIATARFKASGKKLSSPEGFEQEEPQEILTKLINGMEE